MRINVINNIISVVINVLSPLIVLPLLTAQLGLDGYGEYVKTLAFMSMLIIFFDLGFGMYIPKLISSSRSKNLASVFYSFFYIKLFTLPIIIFISYIVYNSEIVIFLLVSLYLIFMNLNLTPIMSGLEKYKELTILTLVCKVILVLLVIITDFSYLGVEKAIAIQVVSQALFFIFCLNSTKKIWLEFKSISMTDLFELLKSSLGYYFSKLIVNLYQQSSALFVSWFLNNQLVAIYSIAIQIYKIGQSIIGAVAKVLFTNLVKNHKYSNLKLATEYSFFAYFLFSPIVFLMTDDIMKLFFEFDVKLLSEMLRYLYVSLAFVIVSSYYGYPALAPINKDKYAHYGVIISSIIYVIVFLMLIKFEYIYLVGFISCIIFSDMIGMIVRLYYYNKFKHIIKENDKSIALNYK
ncbi:oligosaccharide flippase family protein [Aliivibrio fischeri]|uniref:oligosaccharide flippase family protein n=1 Tax=Aliivibrio fischeri TaxID=668 RepID=UPI0007C51F83|nr:oligosaccharide flippase family protein [Aliivibrio fischeri]